MATERPQAYQKLQAALEEAGATMSKSLNMPAVRQVLTRDFFGN